VSSYSSYGRVKACTIYAGSAEGSASGRTCEGNAAVVFSADEGLTWPEHWHKLYDARSGLGYSCLAPADASHIGVLYEGLAELYFLRLPLTDLLGPSAPPSR
jgi:hypothetical protein